MPTMTLPEFRIQLAEEFSDPAAWRSIRERAFGDGDVWRPRDGGGWLDLMHWSTRWAETRPRRVLVEHVAAIGYSTAFWRSIRHAQPLYERDAWHARLQHRARQTYREELRRNIVRLNYPFPGILLPSLLGELSLALWLVVKGVMVEASEARLPQLTTR